MKKAAIITGTSSGIGLALAKILLKKNYIVFGYSRTNKLNHKNFRFIKIDLGSLTSIKKMIFPEIKKDMEVILINNAATIGSILPLDEKSEADIIYEYQLNLITPVLLVKQLINKYPSNKKLIINISSGAANSAIAGWSTYCSSKSALDALTNVIHEEGHKNVQIFSTLPGVVNTKMQQDIRNANPEKFPLLDKFIDYYDNNKLFSSNYVAQKITTIIQNPNDFKSKIINIRDFE